MDDHFRLNLLHAMHRQFGPSHKDKQLAAALQIDRSTANRLRRSPTMPGRERLDALSRYFKVDYEEWSKPPDQFAQAFDRLRRADQNKGDPGRRKVAMSSVVAHQHLWASSFDIHRGHYIAYWKAYGIDRCYVGSLVEIDRLDEDGMRFTMLNPYLRDDADSDKAHFWRYEGVAYPVADYLYFYGEQVGSSYELFTMIMTASPLSPPDMLRGCLSGIYVKDGRKQIAVNVAIVLLYLTSPPGDVGREIGRRLGKLPSNRVPDRVRRLLDAYPGVIPVA